MPPFQRGDPHARTIARGSQAEDPKQGWGCASFSFWFSGGAVCGGRIWKNSATQLAATAVSSRSAGSPLPDGRANASNFAPLQIDHHEVVGPRTYYLRRSKLQVRTWRERPTSARACRPRRPRRRCLGKKKVTLRGGQPCIGSRGTLLIKIMMEYMWYIHTAYTLQQVQYSSY